ncbi:isoaspartyl peptidase-like [Sycon ciliatum]|uniref:isoaspartyl peptidase-like n=1 Tax=Sycon ciliatum TaxID=27933 RepID=UPI0020ACB4BC|eukprot:scpid81770/ scgid29421/ Isoaspartyl peptidase; Beta-aspartyl-peptidase; EcAIII; Isoaspartyl dipeptidase; Isoaspartyl peptidase subunit alpha; Isoaspartyl peptidase subunit beta
MSWTLALHGGAENVSLDEDRKEYKDALAACLDRGASVLSERSPPSFSPYAHLNIATQAVIETVMALEDCDLFNAGHGSLFNEDGLFEMDAQVMDNRGHCGACVGLSRIRNPILAAEKIMSNTPHALVTSPSAEEFAIKHGLRTETHQYFHTERRFKAWQAVREAKKTASGQDGADVNEHCRGTVGAVAKDKQGNIACAVSTGGTIDKMRGRVGDSPIIGGGCYAGSSAGVCGTGKGEVFLYHNTCGRICAAMDYAGLSLQDACEREMSAMAAGSGGVIAIDSDGGCVMQHSTQAMPRAMQDSAGRRKIAIWKEWEENQEVSE